MAALIAPVPRAAHPFFAPHRLTGSTPVKACLHEPAGVVSREISEDGGRRATSPTQLIPREEDGREQGAQLLPVRRLSYTRQRSSSTAPPPGTMALGKCKHCQEPFLPKHENALFCSGECSMSFMSQMRAAYRG